MFWGDVAAPYLAQQGLKANVLESPDWTWDGKADQVAKAVLAWAKANGASLFCHWFQPLGAAGLRHGQSAQVQSSMMEFDGKGKPQWDFDGKMLLKGETDGSSYPNGGLRQTHTAAAYLALDPSSPIFLREDAIFIPACMCSYFGHALDEKTPLLRSMDALSTQGARLMNKLGLGKEITGVFPNIGLEQELFFITVENFKKRPDLQLAGRTVLGKMPSRGQDGSDHYMAPLAIGSKALACMKEVQKEAMMLGIPLRTRHREVAPGQFEFAPLFGITTQQVDQNVMVMQILDEVAKKHGLVALLHEKPFQGVNGSGKHNNWSIALKNDKTNLFNYPQLCARYGEAGKNAFPIIMAAMVQAVNEHGDLLRLAVAAPGNDFRLGACEAPPAIMSTYLGEDLSNFLLKYSQGDPATYNPATRQLDLGASSIAPLTVPAEDRNRTSPFPYGGHRFEFRAVGSSQNVSLVNTILNTITADAFSKFADKIELGMAPSAVAQAALKDNWRAVFNGNGYDPKNQEMLTSKGVWRIDSGVEAISQLNSPKNVAMFSSLGVLTAAELNARKEVQLGAYINLVDIEARTMIEMIHQHVIPSIRRSDIDARVLDSNKTIDGLCAHVKTVKEAMVAIQAAHSTGHGGGGSADDDAKAVKSGEDSLDVSRHQQNLQKEPANIERKRAPKGIEQAATLARTLRLETMMDVRELVDEVEGVVPPANWTLATYEELLFMDSFDL